MPNTNRTETTAEVEIAGRLWNIKVIDLHDPYTSGRWNHKALTYVKARTRIFTSTPYDFEDIFYSVLGAPAPTLAMFPHLALESVYTTRKEYPEVDKAWDRHNRAYVKAQTAALNAVAHLTGVTKARFDKHAGCSCPCSPGFIAVEGENERGTTLYVNVKAAS